MTANYGTDAGEFATGTYDGGELYPSWFVVDDTGNVIILDTYNNRVQIYSSTGRFLGAAPLATTEETSEEERELDPLMPEVLEDVNGIHVIEGRIYAYSQSSRLKKTKSTRLFELRNSSFTDIMSQLGGKTLARRTESLDFHSQNLLPTPLSHLGISTQTLSNLHATNSTIDERGNMWLIGDKFHVLNPKGNEIAEFDLGLSYFVSASGNLYVMRQLSSKESSGFEIVEYPLRGQDASALETAARKEALCRVALSANTNSIKKAYAHDPNVACGQFGETPLFFAVQYGRKDAVRLLLSMGANVNAKDSYGWTPLKIAAIEGNADIARILIATGAKPNAVDGKGDTPLDEAVQNCDLVMTNLLQSSGANSAKDLAHTYNVRRCDRPILEALLEKGSKFDHDSALLSAIDSGADAAALFLIAHGAGLNAKAKDGDTALHHAACRSKLEVLSALVAKGADVNAHANWGTPLHMTVQRYCRLENAAFLIAHGADLDTRDEHDMTPLEEAESYKNEPLAKLLNDALAKTRKKDDAITFIKKENTAAPNEISNAVATVAGFLSSTKSGPFSSPVHDPPSRRETDYSGFNIPIGRYPGMFSALSTLEISEADLLRNEIFARHGYPFKSKTWKTIFSKVSWYKPSGAFCDSSLSQAEKEDIAAIEQQERRDVPPD